MAMFEQTAESSQMDDAPQEEKETISEQEPQQTEPKEVASEGGETVTASEINPETETDNKADNLIELTQNLHQTEQEILAFMQQNLGYQTPTATQADVNLGQIPNQPQPQVPPQANQQQPELEPEEWIEKELYTKGAKAIQEIVNREMEAQGKLLGQALYNILAPMQSEITTARSEREYQKQLKQLQKKYTDLEDYADEMSSVYDKYPVLAMMPNGIEQAYKIASTQIRIDQVKNGDKGIAKSSVRMPQGGRTQLPATASTEDSIREAVFGMTSSKKNVFE